MKGHLFSLNICLSLLMLVLPVRLLAGGISDKDIRQALIAYVEDQAPKGTELVQWELGRGDSLPAAGTILRVEKARGADWKSKLPMRLFVETGAGKVQPHWITAHLQYGQTVLVACRTLPIGHQIRRGDFKAEFMDEWKGKGDLISTIEEVEGKQIRRPVSRGAHLKKWHVRVSTAINEGDTVSIIAQKGCIHIEAPGKIMEAGSPGDVVSVLNVATGKKIYATILDPKTVSVAF